MITYDEAVAIEARFARLLASAHGQERAARAADALTIESLTRTAFWTSLRREEGTTPKLSLASLAPESAPEPFRFARPLAVRSSGSPGT